MRQSMEKLVGLEHPGLGVEHASNESSSESFLAHNDRQWGVDPSVSCDNPGDGHGAGGNEVGEIPHVDEGV